MLAYLLPLPSGLVYAAVGDGGMRLWVFLVLDALGTLLWTSLLAFAGWELGQAAVDLADVMAQVLAVGDARPDRADHAVRNRSVAHDDVALEQHAVWPGAAPSTGRRAELEPRCGPGRGRRRCGSDGARG